MVEVVVFRNQWWGANSFFFSSSSLLLSQRSQKIIEGDCDQDDLSVAPTSRTTRAKYSREPSFSKRTTITSNTKV